MIETPNKLYYRLDENGEPVETTDFLAWLECVEHANHTIVLTTAGDRSWEVSTVFLGINYRGYNREQLPPLLFETMVFGGLHGGDRWRYETRRQAEEGHARAVRLCKGLGEEETGQ